MLRVAFVPKDAYDLLRKDMGAFEYLYMQVGSISSRLSIEFNGLRSFFNLQLAVLQRRGSGEIRS
jgi:hypothetical protein